MYVVSVIWLISSFLNVSIVYPGTIGINNINNIDGAPTEQIASSKIEAKFMKRRRCLELNITAWNFLSLITFVVIFLSVLLPISTEFNEIRAYVVGVASAVQLGCLGSNCICLLFVNHLQPSTAASVAVWLVGVILSLALIVYDIIVLRLSTDALDLASRIFVYSTLTSWLLFTLVNWAALFVMYKKYKKVFNGRKQKLERYMTPRMYLLFLNLKDKIRLLFYTSLFLTLSWIPYVLHIIIIGLSVATGSTNSKLALEFDWREKITLGTTLTVTNTLIVPLTVLINEDTRNNLLRIFFTDDKNETPNTNKKKIKNTLDDENLKYNYSCREIGNVGLVNIPQMCLTDKLNDNDKKVSKQSNESDA